MAQDIIEFNNYIKENIGRKGDFMIREWSRSTSTDVKWLYGWTLEKVGDIQNAGSGGKYFNVKLKSPNGKISKGVSNLQKVIFR